MSSPNTLLTTSLNLVTLFVQSQQFGKKKKIQLQRPISFQSLKDAIFEVFHLTKEEKLSKILDQDSVDIETDKESDSLQDNSTIQIYVAQVN